MYYGPDTNGKYKTKFCKLWLETNKCHYGDRCSFAHGQEELTFAAIAGYHTSFKSKNCRTFYATKQCAFGERCMFRHEHRSFKQLHRHFYTPQLWKLELLLSKSAQSKSKTESVSLQTISDQKTSPLPVFAAIHAKFDAEQASQAQAEQLKYSEADNKEQHASPAKSNCFVQMSKLSR